MINKKNILFISGVAPGPTGVGAVMNHLFNESKTPTEACGNEYISKFIFGSGGFPLRRYLIEKKYKAALMHIFFSFYGELKLIYILFFNKFAAADYYILIHPQSLGFNWVLRFIKSTSKPTWLYLMDSSFFCIKSYNYIDGNSNPCLDCLGGKLENSIFNSCKPFPRNQSSAYKFISKLIELSNQGKVSFITQSKSQNDLVYKQYGSEVTTGIAGLWGSDWNHVIGKKFYNSPSADNLFDIVYHGPNIAAKGVNWAIELADLMPEYSFLFPFKPSGINNFTDNCFFQEMSWNSGLQDAVSASKMTLIPSLWSAPIEGALIKSIAYSKLVAVVLGDSKFIDEIPEGAILKLSQNVSFAAAQVRDMLDPNDKFTLNGVEYYSEFKNRNYNLIDNIIKVIIK